MNAMHRGLQFQVNYTLAEARANYGDLLSGGGFGPGFRGYDLQGWGGLDNEWGLAYFHTKHALIFNGMWELPGKGALLGGWSMGCRRVRVGLRGSGPKRAARDTLSAALRYFSRSTGETESTSPMLSKP